MNKEEYKQYLGTREWKERRKNAIGRAYGKCQLCNSEYRLEVHHRTYERVGKERDDDLTVLCHDCHRRFTKYNRKNKIKEARRLAKFRKRGLKLVSEKDGVRNWSNTPPMEIPYVI